MAHNNKLMTQYDKKKDAFFRKSLSKEASISGSNTLNTNSDEFFVQSSKSTKISKNEKNKEKRPFDKKKWRSQKYSIKSKIEKWEDKRKKAILYKYYKEQKKEENVNFNASKIYENEAGKSVTEHNESSQQFKNKTFQKAHLRFLQIKTEKKQKREEFAKMKAKKEEALKQYKKMKVEKYKRLNKKTNKGQPIMKERMEYLLEKIQKIVE